MRIVYFHYTSFILFLLVCAVFTTQTSLASTYNPLLYEFNSIIDFKSIHKGNIDEATTFALIEANNIFEKILLIEDTMRTFENTLLQLDDMYNSIYKVWNLIGLISSTHPSEETQVEADINDLRMQDYMVDLSLNKDLYYAILIYSKSKEAQTLSGGRKRFLQTELTDFRRSGMALSNEKRKELKVIQRRISELSIAFSNNITANTDTLFINEELLGGLPYDYKRQRIQSDGRYAIDLSNPSFYPFMKYADSDSLRKILRLKYLNIGYPENIEILDSIILNSNKLATILGYASYAAYSMEQSMAQTPAVVWEFENSLRKRIEEKAYMDIQELLMIKRKITDKENVIINDWDKHYYENKLLRIKYNVDSNNVKEYFELNRVIKGFYEITGRLFGIKYRKIENPSVWHKDVTMYEMYDEVTGNLIGRFYLDLYPRLNKYQHAAEFTIISGKSIGNKYQIPVASLICNFPKPRENNPSLLSHDNVETFFHEFGHLIHDLLSKTELMSQSGTSVAMDFVEAPSQMFENWVWNKESLRIFAKHYKTDRVIPDNLIDDMLAARNLQSGNDLLQQIFYGILDLTLYNGYDPEGLLNTTDIVMQLQNSVTHYPYFEGTHQEASFDHLLDYSASYYGYLWSEIYAQDMFSVFKDGGVLNPKIGKHYRESILEKGGSEDPMKLVIKFLGRKPDNDAFLQNLGIN